MASNSHTTSEPWCRQGTLSERAKARMFALVSGRRSRITVSRNGMPSSFSASHGLSDQLEKHLLPMNR